jgi:Polysaccharide deacetylase
MWLSKNEEFGNPSRSAEALPLLITLDLEIAPDHDLDEQQEILRTLREDLRGTPATVFVTGDAVDRFAEPVRELVDAGHEFGCHGLTHAFDEDFCRMPPARLQSLLAESTARINRVTGQRPRVFRGPRMATSADTQRALIDFGYAADFSVCPQRLDLFNCRGAHPGWLAAPRIPYRASSGSPYRRGDLPLTVVPLSTLGIPLISGSLFLFGLAAMKLLFRCLAAEARRTGAPLVYLFHSYEFTRYLGGSRRPPHQRLYTSDPARRLAMHRQFLRFMLEQRGVVPVTASAFLDRCQTAPAP